MAIQFYFSTKNQRKIALYSLFFALLGGAIAAWQFFDKDNAMNLMLVVVGTIVAIGGLAYFVKLIAFPRKADEVALLVDANGISAKTGPIPKALGLIHWRDITDIEFYDGEIILYIRDYQKYTEKIKNVFVRDTFKSMKGQVRISIIEVACTKEEVRDAVKRFY